MSAQNIMKFPENKRYDCDSAQTFTACKLPKNVPDAIKKGRGEAFERFKERGLPTPKLERFKYTNIAKMVAQWDGILADAPIQVENGGVYVSDLQHVLENVFVCETVLAEPPGAAKYGDMSLWDMNTAYLRDGVFVDIPVDKVVDKPIVLNITNEDDTYTSRRYVIRVGRNAQVTIVEKHSGAGECWKNDVTQITLGENAKLTLIRIVQDGDMSVYSQNTHIVLERDSVFEGFSLNMGEGALRHQMHVDIKGAGAHASLNGLNLLKNKSHADTTITIEHQAPNCQSNQFYRSLIADKAHGVFQGKVHVHEKAQKTDGYQLSNAILLSGEAQMDTKPELEIYADDVKCSHGATTGQLDEEPLFYLRSRGLNEAQARLLLIQAFVGEVLEKIPAEDLRETIEKDVDQWLRKVL